MEVIWLSTEFWVQIVVYAVSIGSLGGALLTRIRNLEKKQDKHNQLVERMVVVEQSCKVAHYRIDEIRKENE